MDQASWPSSDPVGSIILIDIPFDDGIVVCTESTSNRWRFNTITGAYPAGYHPVSGTREFGFTQNSDGSYNFYTRGVDRTSTALVTLFGDNLAFDGADALWMSFQDKLASFINTRGGNSAVKEPIIGRPNWEEVADYIMGNKDISELGCKE